MSVVTLKGTVIERYRPTGVGKLMGCHLYLHKNYVRDAISAIKSAHLEIGLKLAVSMATKKQTFPQLYFNCVRFDLKEGNIRFDEVPDFDTAREPTLGSWLLVCPDGQVKSGRSYALFHHKWLWVKPGYANFDIEESVQWSKTYCSILTSPPKSSVNTWTEQLAQHGLC